MNMPAFISMRFLQWLDIDTLAPFDGIDNHLNGFLLRCQFYFESILNPKPEEKQWLIFLPSRFTGGARQWVELLITTGTMGLGIIAEFICLMRVIYEKGDVKFNLDFLGRASLTAEPSWPFPTFYEWEPEVDKAVSIPVQLEPEVNRAASPAEL